MIREFKTFIAVARNGTFTGAGRQLGLTQSAVSAQIRRLEAYLGATLFDRSARSAVLSAAGRELLSQAEDVVAMAERMVMAGQGTVTGLLRIGAIASVQQGLLAGALAEFRLAYPGVRVRVVPGVSLTLLGQVDAGEVDLSVLIRPPFALPPELVWRSLVREPIVLVMPALAPRMPWREALAAHPFIRYDRSSFGGRLVDGFLKQQRLAVREAVELDEIDAIANLVRHGLGVALLPRTRQLDTRGLWLADLGQAALHREIGIIVRASQDTTSMAGQMADCLARAASRGGQALRRRPRSAATPDRSAP